MAKYKFIKDQFGENCSVRYEENGHSYSFLIKGLDYTSNTEYINYKES